MTYGHVGKRSRRAATKQQTRSIERETSQPLADAGASRDIHRVVVIACAAMVAGMACSRPLWLFGERLYPQIPVVQGIAAPSFALNAALVLVLLVSFVASALPKTPAWFRAVPVGVIAILVALDLSRLQPWVFMYAIILLAAAFASRTDGRNASILMTLRFMIAAQYLWSGLQKANYSFVEQVWPTFADPLFRALHLPLSAGHAAGLVVPLLEIAVGCCLFVPRTRRVGVIAACITHATILASLLASGENLAVWPWNVAMPLFDFVLFWNATTIPWTVSSIRRFPQSIAFGVLVGILPALSFLGYWDSYASWALYSGNTAQAVVVIDPSALNTLPDVLRRNTWQESRPMFVDLNRWSYDELQVPIYPETRVFRVVGRYVCEKYTTAAVALVILRRPDWRTGQRERTRFQCGDPTW
jgi:uncharacterized membrane protein YphA (DoxX/SURF4 family)